jgi:hypothetical protein
MSDPDLDVWGIPQHGGKGMYEKVKDRTQSPAKNDKTQPVSDGTPKQSNALARFREHWLHS